MYSQDMLASIKKVEATRASRIGVEPRRMSAEEKDALLKEFHPDYRDVGFDTLRVGVNKGDKVPVELRALLERGVPRDSTALQAIGYKELLSALDGLRPLEEAVAEIKLRSRQYAKRQLTWLRRNSAIHWIYWKKERDFSRALRISTEILHAAGVG